MKEERRQIRMDCHRSDLAGCPDNSRAIHYSGLRIHPREPNQPVRVQLIGGDAGSGINNWFGEFTVFANGANLGVWHPADDNAATASLLTFDAAANSGGNLTIELSLSNAPRVNSNGSFAGYAAAVVTAVPEPTAVGALGLASLGLIPRRWRRQ